MYIFINLFILMMSHYSDYPFKNTALGSVRNAVSLCLLQTLERHHTTITLLKILRNSLVRHGWNLIRIMPKIALWKLSLLAYIVPVTQQSTLFPRAANRSFSTTSSTICCPDSLYNTMNHSFSKYSELTLVLLRKCNVIHHETATETFEDITEVTHYTLEPCIPVTTKTAT